MSEVSPSLSVFEEQLLQVLAASAPVPAESSDIKWDGEHLLYQGWGGEGRLRANAPSHAGCTYPAIDLALGRLRHKGLVMRTPSSYYRKLGYRAGEWTLTEQGGALMGMDLS